MENEKDINYLTVKDAAKILGVNPETLRRWDRKGKLTARRHPMSNYRIYDKAHITKIKKGI